MNRGRAAITGAVISALALALACDIFHSTDLPTRCTEMPFLRECQEAGADAGADTNIDPFTASQAQALEHAKTTCAWIAACETPFGENETGRCIVNAILAFDSTTNPHRKLKGDARAFWQCAANAAAARSCDAIKSCMLPKGLQACSGGVFAGCAGAGNEATRVICTAANQVPPAERCAAIAKTCGALDPKTSQHDALCTGPQGRECMTSGCMGGKLSACDDAGVDLGTDCTLLGAGACDPDAGACVPEGTSGVCAQTGDINCDDAGFAVGCATGRPEKVDCKAISGACSAVPSAPGWVPPSAACKVIGCPGDACNGGTLEACVRGRTVSIDCAILGLGPCAPTTTTTDGTRAACTKK